MDKHSQGQDEKYASIVSTKENFHLTQASVVHRTFNHQLVWEAQACKKKTWLQFDEDASSVLEVTAKGNGNKNIQAMTTTIVMLAT